MVGSIKVNDVRHGALGRMILIVLLAIILGAALAQSDTPEQRAIAEASRMIGVPRAESGPRGASAYAGDENPFVGRHLSIRLDGPRKVAQAEWQKNPKDLGMVEQAAPWGGTLAQQWSPYWYWKEGDPPQMMGPPIGAYLVWEWTYPAHIARVEVRFPVVEREVSFERALAIMRPIAEAIHLGAMAQRLAASAPPQAQRNTPGAVRRAGQASSSWAHFTSKPSFTANQPLRACTPTTPPAATTAVLHIARRTRRVLERPGCRGERPMDRRDRGANPCKDRRSASNRQEPHCRVAWETNDLVTFKPAPVKGAARRVIAAAIRLTANALLARQHRRC